MPLSALTMRRVPTGVGILLVAALLMFTGTARAEGEDQAVIDKVTNLNKKALAAYNNLDFDDARKLLKQALDLCSSAGLDKHPINARTHIHMGVVLIASKQQELGVKQFKKALEIQPDIQVTKALANPEILQAFQQAAESGPDTGDAGGGTETSEGTPPPSGAGSPSEVTGDITVVPVSRAKKGKPVVISASVSPDFTGYAKLVLAYRAAGLREFTGVDMRRSGNKFIAEIPAEATQGRVVHYYVEAEAADESPVSSNGSETKPYAVYLSADAPSGGGNEGDEVKSKFYLGLAVGSGMGYATGNGELNADNKVKGGFALSAAGQIVPEVGYFLMPEFRLSLQTRIQYVTGRTSINLDKLAMIKPNTDLNSCGSDHICSTGSPFAVSVFARGTWFLGSGTFQPYLSFALGGGVIRHVVTFKTLMTICGDNGNQACVDSVVAGPIFAGPGGGLYVVLTPMFGLIVEANSVLGFPKFTFHVDLNVGAAVRF
jgi:hypothetical protein